MNSIKAMVQNFILFKNKQNFHSSNTQPYVVNNQFHDTLVIKTLYCLLSLYIK